MPFVTDLATSSPRSVYGDRIQKNNGYDHNSFTYIPICIIGAGESGIAMGAQLKEQLAFSQFRIFERQSGWGGTWWINRYPGVACDVPAVFYSFSFAPNKSWTSLYPSGPEIVKYLDGVCAQYELIDKIQLNTDVTEAQYNPSEKIWELTIHSLVPGTGDLSAADRQKLIDEKGESAVYLSTERIRTKILISCVGGLVEPNQWPANVSGKEDFKGEIFHSARWNYDIDLKDKNVVVIGSGCSAAQFVPEVATTYGAKKVTQIMRSPPWVVPKEKLPMSRERWQWLNVHAPGFHKLMRYVIASKAEFDWRLFRNGEYSKKERAKVQEWLLEHMRSVVPEKYHEILTPDYDVACKRRIFDETWFPSLTNPKISLTTQELLRVNTNSVTLGAPTYPPSSSSTSETEVPADVIILGNGFQTKTWFHPLSVRGSRGQTLNEVWATRGGPQMYLGACIDSFPNFFTIFGPNTATGHSSVILATENMVNYTLKLIAPILKGEVESVEVKEGAARAYAQEMQRELEDTVWKAGCRSWYFDEVTGWNSTVYPYSQVWFTIKCMWPRYADYRFTYTAKGAWKRRLRLLLRLVLMVVVFLAGRAAYGMGLQNLGLDGWKFVGKQVVARLALAGSQGLRSVAERVQ